METETMATEQEPASEWHVMARELLKSGQYKGVVELLETGQTISEQGDDAILADILVAAGRVCLALVACQAEVGWHKRAYKDAGQRELELKQQLQAMLDLVTSRRTFETQGRQAAISAPPTVKLKLPEYDPPKQSKRRSLWQRVQNLLGRRPSPRSSANLGRAAEFTKAPVETFVEKSEEPGIPPAEEAEAAAAPPTEKAEVAALPSFQKAETPASPYAEEAGVSAAPPAEKEEAERDLPALAVHCLGPFRVYQNNQLVVEWNSLKGQAILKYLVAHNGGPVAKDILMDVFWPDVDPGDTRRNLHQAIYGLRQTLRRRQPALQPIQFTKNCYLLEPGMGIWLDFEEFERHVQVGRHLETAGPLSDAMAEYNIAEGLYQGDFLEEDLYEDWPRLQRRYLRNLYLDIADRLSAYYVQQREYTAVMALCQKILVKDNCREEAYRRLMQCYLAQGQRHLAIRQYQTCVQALEEELDLTPSEKTVELYQHIITGV
jgi:DNA-binding SARP family transcriptional activator